MKIFFPKIPFLKKMLPRSLFARSLLILTVPIILTLSISTYVFFERHWERMAGRLASAVAGEAAFLIEQIQENEGRNIESLEELSRQHLKFNLKYVEAGKIRPDFVEYEGRSDVIRRLLKTELDVYLKYPYRIIVDVEENWIQIQAQVNDNAIIFTLPESRLFSSSGYVFLIWMVGISSVLMVVAILFMRNQIRPIKRLAIAAERFGRGRDVPFFKVEGAREVRQAARAFLGMRERINKQIQQHTAMLAGVSHDLRTPLTRMKLQVEMMKGNPDADALKEDIQDMQRMIDAYLQFAKGEGSEEMERVDLRGMLQRLSQNYARQNFDVKISSEGQNFTTFVKPVAFERCLSNLLTNAQKYAQNAWCLITEDGENIQIIIDDDGKGIAEENHEDVFKPFFREDKSRNVKSGSVGLGLPIAQDIILAHGGDIKLDKSPQGGLRVILTLAI